MKNAKRQRRSQLKEQVDLSNGKKRKRDSEDDGGGTIKRRRIEKLEVPPSTIQKQTGPSTLEDTGSITRKEQVCQDMLQNSLPPVLLDSLEIGLNEVTKALERSITTLRSCQAKKQLPSDFKPISLVLVCLADINPPNLVAHIPHLVSVYNSMLMTQGIAAPKKRRKGPPLLPVPSRPEGIKLVTLPKNAESSLAGSIGLRRISVVAFYVGSFFFSFSFSLSLSISLTTSTGFCSPWSASYYLALADAHSRSTMADSSSYPHSSGHNPRTYTHQACRHDRTSRHEPSKEGATTGPEKCQGTSQVDENRGEKEEDCRSTGKGDGCCPRLRETESYWEGTDDVAICNRRTSCTHSSHHRPSYSHD